jgi:hypothetical protein
MQRYRELFDFCFSRSFLTGRWIMFLEHVDFWKKTFGYCILDRAVRLGNQ